MEEIVDFIFELNTLKRVRRSGSWIAGITHPDTVAEHSWRAVVIGFVLARLEDADPYKTAMMLAFHDVPETRIGDIHKITAKYIDSSLAEQQVQKDQASLLPDPVRSDVHTLFEEWNERTTKESLCAKDADLLELAFQAKEYLELGVTGKVDWLKNVEKALQTESAKKLFSSMQKKSMNDWWRGLKKL